jgi:predicted phosphoribosyltransferase
MRDLAADRTDPHGHTVCINQGVRRIAVSCGKLGAPARKELAMGPIASGGVNVLDADMVRSLGITGSEIGKSPSGSSRSWSGARASIGAAAQRSMSASGP